jgi:hypothetical protein
MAPTSSQAREINHNMGSINQRQTKIGKAALKNKHRRPH